MASAPLPRRVREALLAVHEAVFELVVDRLGRLIPQLESKLAHVRDRGAQHTVNVTELDPAQLLARRQSAFIQAFAHAVDAEFAALRETARAPRPLADAPPTMPTFEELRLLDDDEADEDSEIKAIALRLESRAPLPIHLLCQRFAVLAEAPAFEPGRLPVGPRRLCELMIAAAESTAFPLALRIALLREFERGVLGDYPAIAESINDLLARHRVMPGLSFVPLRLRARPVESAADAAARSTAAEAAAPDAPHTGWAGAPSADVDAPTFRMLQDLLAARRSMADRFRGGGFAPGSGNASGGGGGGGSSGETAGAAADPGAGSASGTSAPGAVGRPELTTAAVLEILREGGPDVAELDIDALRQWVLLQARHRRGTACAISREDADVFELLGLMYAHLQRDVRPDSPAQDLLDRLRLPLLRLVLADAGFFVRASHPAREVLNAVAESGARFYAPEDVDPQLLLHLGRIVDSITAAQDDMGLAFRNAAAALEAQLQGVARRADVAERRNVEAARGKDRLATARRRASEVIEAALGTARVPAFHRGMLRHAWADVLTLAHLRHDENSAEWTGLVEATAELVRAAGGKVAAGPDLVLQVDHWLVTVGYHADDAGRIARILSGTADDDCDDAATRTELTMRLKSRARLGEDAIGDADGAIRLDAAGQARAARIRELPAGTWFDLGAPGHALRRRLSWLGPVTGLALFVNPRGQRVAESSVDALARDLGTGDARIVTAAEGRLVDRAWRAALQSLATGGSAAQESVA
ncbi:DUF1631 family protein [Lysobacter xanthus]